MEKTTIYSDGACIGNPGPGGWAAVLVSEGDVQSHAGRYRNTTNNRMELRAAIEGLERVRRPCRVVLVTDSVYLRNGITRWIHRWQRNNWRTAAKRPVKNRDLWERLLQATELHAGDGGVEWEWTKGHAGHEMNELADRLANQEARSVSDADPEDVPPDDGLPLLSAS